MAYIENVPEIVSICREIRQGDMSRAGILWTKHTKGLTAIIARRYGAVSPAHVTFDDLLQSGYIAMISAAQGFEPDRGASWGTYYGWAYSGEVARLCGWGNYRRELMDTAESLDAPLPNDDNDDTTLNDIIGNDAPGYDDVERRIYNEQLHNALEGVISTLKPAQQYSVRRYYFSNETHEQIAGALNMTPQRVSQIIRSSLMELGQYYNRKYLEEYIELKTPYYLMVSPARFQSTQTSPVERIAIIRETIRNRTKRDEKVPSISNAKQ